MKLHILILCITLYATLWAISAIALVMDQTPFIKENAKASTDSDLHVPGNNNAIYGPTPKREQLLEVLFFDIAPSAILGDRILFLYLRGNIHAPIESNLDDLLATSTLTINLSTAVEDGRVEQPLTYTIPFRTKTSGSGSHMSIRDERGAYVDHPAVGYNDFLAHVAIPDMSPSTGEWKIEAEAKLGDDTCLFSITMSQWLEGQA